MIKDKEQLGVIKASGQFETVIVFSSENYYDTAVSSLCLSLIRIYGGIMVMLLMFGCVVHLCQSETPSSISLVTRNLTDIKALQIP